MDLRSIMNDGKPEEKKSSPPPSVSRIVPPPTPPNPNGHPLSAGGHPHLVNTGLHRPPSSGIGAHSPHARTPIHGPGGTHYPFPPQPPPHPSPGAPPGHLSQPPPPSAVRPPSQAHAYNQHPPHYPPQTIPQGRTTTQSPTGSRHSQTPHSLRQSPLPGQAQPPHHHALHSQPSTPLGPPSLPHQRTSGQFHDLQSPYHARTLSGASNGFAHGSPVSHNAGIGSLIDSPSVPQRQSPYRRVSDYSDGRSRERSVSVSPKTMVPPRPPSLGSRTSSQQDVRSNRSSAQPNEAHHMHPTHSPYATNHVSQHTSLSAPSPQTAIPLARSGGPTSDVPLSQVNNHHTIQHQTQKMGMNHLLSPATEAPRQTDGVVSGHGAHEKFHQTHQDRPLAHSPTSQPPPALPPSDQPRPPQVRDQSAVTRSPAMKAPLKRPAEVQLDAEPPAKRGKIRKYPEPPIWARLSQHNPKIRNGGTSAPASKNQHAVQAPQAQPQAQPNGISQIQTTQPAEVNANLMPWQHNPPLDNDLMNARNILGQWERSIIYNEPYIDLHRVVQDWLFMELEKLGEIGNDPLEGAVEIEAKIGYIKSRNTGERLILPVRNAVVLDDSLKDSIAFESEMELISHKAMNDFLNQATQNTMVPGRAQSKYTHPRLTDSFRPLSTFGFNALPVPFQRRPKGRELSLRTSVDDKTGEVAARIVKIPVANLHIYNPGHPYDCRISINLEANLNRPDLAPYTDLIDESQAPRPNRKKDRMSYKHLAYAIDLTKVEVPGLAPKFELEVEVDPTILREHQQRCKNGQIHAYQDIVAGFLNNVTLLMRQPRGS